MINFRFLRVGAIVISCALSFECLAQSNSISMSLDECLEYARENSITLKKAQLDIEDNQSLQLSSKGAFLPTISGSVSQGLSSYFLNDDSSLSGGIYNGSYGVDLSMTLYSGGSNRAQLQKSILGGDIASLEMEELENSLEVAITEVYVEILYSIEQIQVAKSSLEISQRSEQRGRAFLEVGSINEADFAQLVSATASDMYDIVVAETQLSNLYIILKQLLEISGDVTLQVKELPLSDEALLSLIPSTAEVFDVALDTRPEIESSKMYIESAEYDLTMAKAGYLPTLSLTAGTGVNHISSSSYDFTAQLRNNFTTSIGLNLSIPIFNGYKNKSNVAISQNSVKSASLSLTEEEKNLYQTIESIRNNAVSAQAKYSASEYMLQATIKSMELTEQQYEVGLKNIIELLTEQDNYSQTYQEHLVNKYQLILNKALLNFYKTNIIKL
ncbi:MAG: TolC family protein [Rikenellaceae bacterium]